MNITVHKFGGASIKDANAIKNVADIIKNFPEQFGIVVISAMGKMTNALEDLTKAYFFRTEAPTTHLDAIKKYHSDIIQQLFPHSAAIDSLLTPYWLFLENQIQQPVQYSFNQIYDQMVSVGELISSTIVSEYLSYQNIENTWLDIRNVLISDTNWRNANIKWEESSEKFNRIVSPKIHSQFIITQGFIASTAHQFTTTLGREGSDYTAAILANLSDAKELIIWKDVPGILNGDPRYFKNSQKIDELSYYDAVEMTYYGATVIHPKTIKPLQNKNIPLKVKSFINPKDTGTVIYETPHTQKITTYSYLPKQILISIYSLDYAFFTEEHIQKVFQIINEFSIKIHLMQNTALNFSICIDNDELQIPAFIQEVQKHFKVLYNTNVALMTIRNYVPSIATSIIQGKKIFLEQRTRNNLQVVIEE